MRSNVFLLNIVPGGYDLVQDLRINQVAQPVQTLFGINFMGGSGRHVIVWHMRVKSSNKQVRQRFMNNSVGPV